MEPFVDGWECAEFNSTADHSTQPYLLTDQTIEEIPIYFGKLLNEGIFWNDQAISLHCTTFFNEVIGRMTAKRDMALNRTEIPISDFDRNIKYLLFSGHD